MANDISWINAIKRGFKPGIEIKVVSAGKNTGKTIVFDIESDDFKPWRETFLTHYAEYRDFDTGETYWKKFGRRPNTTQIRYCNNVIRHNEDGTYEYVKNRETGELRQLSEQEIMWVLLHV